MRYLVCGLNDENYSEPEYIVEDSFSQAKETAKRWCLEFADGEDYEMTKCEENEDGWRQTVTYYEGYPYDGERFYVTEIKEIEPHHSFMVVYHHGYNGVDFTIEHYGSISQCRDYIEEKAKEFDEEDIQLKSVRELLIDNGTEWEMWTVLSI